MEQRYRMSKQQGGKFGWGYFIEHTDKKMIDKFKKEDPFVWKYARIQKSLQAYPSLVKVGIIYDYEPGDC